MTDANFSAPRRPFWERRINALKVAWHPFQPEPASRNGLSLPRNDLPVAKLPLRDRSFRPAASMPCRTSIGSVRFTAPSLSPVCPGSGEIRTANPFPDSSPTTSTSHQISTTLQGFCAPPDRTFQPGNCSRGSPSGCVRSSFAPRRLLYWNSRSWGLPVPPFPFLERLSSLWHFYRYSYHIHRI